MLEPLTWAFFTNFYKEFMSKKNANVGWNFQTLAIKIMIFCSHVPDMSFTLSRNLVVFSKFANQNNLGRMNGFRLL